MSTRPRIVLAGGGPAAVEAALALRELAGERFELELITPHSELVVRAYEVLAPFHEGRERRYSLQRIARDLDFELVRGELITVDDDARTAVLRAGTRRDYDALVVAVGARRGETIKGAIPFRGAGDATRLKQLLMQSHSGRRQNVAFVVPYGASWPLPLYELALHTAAWLHERDVAGVPIVLVTPEHTPLASFGARASEEVAAVLESHGVEFVTGHALRLQSGQLLLSGGRELAIDLAVALARLKGPAIAGLPSDADGFVLVDGRGRVAGLRRVFAAGDATAFPIKQGGLATQQADAIAECFAAEVGVSAAPEPASPVLRAVLFGGRETRYLQAELGARLEQTSEASASPLWPGSGKLIGRYLSPYLDALDQSETAGIGEAAKPA